MWAIKEVTDQNGETVIGARKIRPDFPLADGEERVNSIPKLKFDEELVRVNGNLQKRKRREKDRTVEEKLATIGLTIPELKAALNRGNP
jgi:hypothetical protein